jgi:hypothetical protein
VLGAGALYNARQRRSGKTVFELLPAQEYRRRAPRRAPDRPARPHRRLSVAVIDALRAASSWGSGSKEYGGQGAGVLDLCVVVSSRASARPAWRTR